MLVSVKTNNTQYYKNKRFIGTFKDGKKVYFGLKNPKIGAFIDHKNETLKKNFISRHKKNLKENKRSPAYLATFILWNKPTIRESIKDYNMRLKNNNFNI